MSLSFRIILGEVPDPDHIPIGKIYRPGGLVIAVLQPQIDPIHLVRSARKAITLPEWRQWVAALQDPNIDPTLSWHNPEEYLPKPYWEWKVIQENIPPDLRV